MFETGVHRCHRAVGGLTCQGRTRDDYGGDGGGCRAGLSPGMSCVVVGSRHREARRLRGSVYRSRGRRLGMGLGLWITGVVCEASSGKTLPFGGTGAW